MKLYVKYMVSIRCRLIVKDALVQLGYPYCVTSKGIINLPQNLLAAHRKELSAILRASGMVLLDKKKSHLVDKIDQVIDASLQREKPVKSEKISQLLEKEVGEKFAALANLISEVKGVSIEHYQLMKKIEVVKERLIYEDASLTEIAMRLGFGSRSIMSYQFKKVTGLSPTYYKMLREKRFKDAQTHAIEYIA